ncbi:ABC transporter substrate-binding protein [Waterburya agarophytonicola K14]|uniref:ABC transporter substrate-binding protein n=1 Tax=Waterburya agarophytonicola KI4 TaxID=2874699 RepID=A0A964BPR0_9CYAN|nr:ABC transporter substrate-binding protein [Waterburya agarophytonicola]MCC0175891.1 ABC transporter substrate-binding protein [Waterburya agarophytonicola KI4]
MLKKLWILAFLLIGSFLLFNWQNNFYTTETTPPLANSTITIGYSNWAGWWPWAIAEQKGLFAKHNLQVELRWYDDYSQSMEDLAAGYIDGNCQTLNDTISFAAEAVKGEVVVLVNDNSAGNDKIIAEAGIDKVEDLKSKMVAVEAGVVDDFLLTLALDRVGMSRKDVQILDVETGAAVEAFIAGQANAVGAFPPFWYTALKKEGAHEITSSAEFPGAIPDLLIVSRELIDWHPEKVQALVDTWFDTLDFMTKNIEEADQIMASRAGVSPQELQLLKSGTKMFSLEDNLVTFNKSNDITNLFNMSKEITDFLQQKLDIIDEKPDISRLLDSQFVEAYSKSS